MDPRPKIQTELEALFDSIPHVYFQPPPSVQLVYPCIVYELDSIDHRNADNRHYIRNRSYSITVIDRDPDSNLRERVADLEQCRFSRAFVNDNLYHFTFTLYK